MWNPLQAVITALTDINELFSSYVWRFFVLFPAFVGVCRLHVILTHCEEVRNELAVSLQGGWGSRLGVSLVFSPVRITQWSSLSPLRIAMDDGGSMELEVQVSTELWKPRRSPVDTFFHKVWMICYRDYIKSTFTWQWCTKNRRQSCNLKIGGWKR